MNSHDGLLVALLIAVACLYAVAWLLIAARHRNAGLTALTAGWVLNAGVIALNAWVAGAPPLGNMYHVQVVLAACLPPLFAVVAWREKLAWTGHYFALISALPVIGALFMERDALWRRMPALQSPWFVPHVLAYMIGYALAAIAFALLAAKWIKRLACQSPDLKRYEHASSQIIRLAFPFLTFGMLSGALWAEKAWGQYWSWDPKETWSLITWTLYLIALHARRNPAYRRYADVGHALAFAALLVTFFLVNLLPRLASALHSYA